MADRYWVGGTATWDSFAGTKWSATSGGAGGQTVPTATDNVFFDGNSGTGTVTVTGSRPCQSLHTYNLTTGSTFAGTFAGASTPILSINGSFFGNSSGYTISSTITFSFVGAGTGLEVRFPSTTVGVVGFNAPGTWTFQTGLSTLGLSIFSGTVNTNGYSINSESMTFTGSTARTINLGSSTITLTSSSSISAATTSNLTFNAGTSNIVLSGAGANLNVATTTGLGIAFNNVSFTSVSSTTTTISGANTFNNLSITGPSSIGVKQVTFNSPQVINGTLSTTGTAGNRRVWFRGLTYGIAQTLTVNSPASLTNADFRDIYVTGTAAPISGTRIGDLRGIRGITASTPKTVYWNLAGAQNWSTNGWAATPAGTPSTDNFPLAQDTATFTNAGSVTGTITLDLAIPYIGTVDMSGRTTAMTLARSNAYTVYGNWLNGSGTTLSGTELFTFSGRNTQTITSAGKTFAQPITIDSYGGTVQLADALNSNTSIIVVNGTFDTQNYNVVATFLLSSNSNVRTIKLGMSTVTLTSSGSAITFTNSVNLTLDPGTSSIVLTSANNTITVAGGGLTFYNLSFATGSTNPQIIIFSGLNTFNNLSFAAPSITGKIQEISFAANQTINGTLTCSGASAVSRVFLQSNTLGTQRDLIVNTLVADDCDFRDIDILGPAAGTAPTRAGDCGGNLGITFPAAKTVYWNLAGTQNWSAIGWAATSGGTPDIDQFPLAQDTAVFDNTGAAGTVNIDTAWNLPELNFSARTSAMTFNHGGYTPTAYGGWVWGTGVTSTAISTGRIVFASRATKTFTSNGVTTGFNITIDSATGTLQLGDALVLSAANVLTLTNGTFDAVTYNVTTGLFNCTTATNTTLKMGSGTWTISGVGSVWLASSVVGVLYKGTANIVLSNTSSTGRTFNGASQSYNKLTIGGATGTSALIITGDNQFTELASTKAVAHTIDLGSTTQTFGAWTVTGTAGNMVALLGTGTTHILAGACTSGINYLAMGSIGFGPTSPGEFYAGANSTGTAAAPVYRTAKPADATRYWVGGTGNWSSTTNWSATSGGASGASVPRSHDDVVFNTSSNPTAYTATVDAVVGGIRCKGLTINGPLSGNVTLAGSSNIVGVHGNVFLSGSALTRTYSGALILSGSTNGKTFTTNGVVLSSILIVNGVGCGWSLGSAFNNSASNITVTNGSFSLGVYNLTTSSINSNNTNLRTINLGSGTITLSGTAPINFGTTEIARANLNVIAGTSQINCSANDLALNGNNQTFYNVRLTSTNISTDIINGANTFNNLTVTGSVVTGVAAISLSANQIINGTLTLSAGTDATMRTFLRSDTIGTTRTLTCAAFSGTDADFRDITIVGPAAPVSGTRLGDCRGNSGIVFSAPKTVYRVNAGGSTLNTSNAWSNISGGSPNYIHFPLAQDTAVFDNNSYSGLQTSSVPIGTLDFTNRTTAMNIALVSGDHYGDLLLSSACTTSTESSTILFVGRTTQYIRSSGVNIRSPFEINSPGGSVVLSDAMNLGDTTYGTLTVTRGTFNANGYNVTLAVRFSSTNTNIRTINVGSGTWTIPGSGATAWTCATSTNLTVTGTGTISMTRASAKTFSGGGVSYAGITLNQGGAGALTITGNNTFANITNTYKATGATSIALGTTTQRVGTFTAAGEAGRVLTITGTSATSPATLILTGASKPNVDYLTITGIRAYDLTDTWYAGANSKNNGSLGWNFESLGGVLSSIFYGNINVQSIFYGSTPVSAIYYGSTKVY